LGPIADSERYSPRHLARIAGILGLAGIATGAFDIGYVQSTLIVAGSPALTLHNIAAHQGLFRMGFSAHIIELLINIPGEVIAFYLFRRVNLPTGNRRDGPGLIHARSGQRLCPACRGVGAGGPFTFLGLLWR